MPEGHVTHGLARDHKRLLGGRVVRAASPQGRFEVGAATIDGRRLVGTDAVGKHLFHRYRGSGGPDVWLHVHLGLYGKFRTGHGVPPEPVGQVRLRLSTDGSNDGTDDRSVDGSGDRTEDGSGDGTAVWMELRGPTACELLDAAQVRSIRDRLGPDPLRRGADPNRAWERLSRSRTAIGALLMDQSVLAGVGNVFRAEVLFRHGIDPHRPGNEVDRASWDAVWLDLVSLMRSALKAGRIVTTEREDRSRRRGPALPEDAHYVYRRQGQPCRRCGETVLTETFVGRNLFWCPTCQR